MLEALYALPYKVLRPPNLRLRTPNIQRPRSMVVFGFVYVTYFLVLAGIIYDIINEPPSVGQRQDPETGQVRPEAIIPYRINAQYIIEGLAASFLFALGGAGFILLDLSGEKSNTPRDRNIYLTGGLFSIVIAYSMCVVFIRMKLPGYLR